MVFPAQPAHVILVSVPCVEELRVCCHALEHFIQEHLGRVKHLKEIELLRAAFQGTKCSFSSLRRAVLNLSCLGFTLCRSVPERHATHSPTGGFSRCSSECLADLPKAGRDQEESINPRNQLQARCQACLARSKNLFRTWPGESEPLRLSSQRKRLNSGDQQPSTSNNAEMKGSSSG